MINKIEHIISIGKFRNFQAVGDIAFKNLTLIYGDNGGGKTTLTSILRSATLNEPEIIKLRQSTNETTSQSAKIIQRNIIGDSHHTFHFSRGWTVPIDDIEIFDSHFVDENIHSGFDFNDGHKKQLHQFVIGAQGVAIQQQIEQNKIAKSTSKATQTTLENQLIQLTGNGLNSGLLATFLNIPVTQAANVNQQIIDAEAALASARSNAVIQTLQRLSQISNITTSIDPKELKQDLQLTTSAIQDTALKIIFDNHCQDLIDNSIKAPEPWLKTGFSFLESKHEKSEG